MYRGFHLQNLDGYPGYWQGYPPMKYATHALAPLLALTGSQVDTVTALGTGRLTPERLGELRQPVPRRGRRVPAARQRRRRGRPAVVLPDRAHLRRGLRRLRRARRGGVAARGGRPAAGVRPPAARRRHAEHRPARTTVDRRAAGARRPPGRPRPRARPVPARGGDAARRWTGARRCGAPSTAARTPTWSTRSCARPPTGEQPWVDARRSAAWTAPGICAHESALAGGVPVQVPQY